MPTPETSLCRLMELVVTMDIGLLISLAGCSTASPASNILSENDQLQQLVQSGSFSTMLKGVAQHLSDEEPPSLSNADDPIELAPSMEAGKQVTGAAVSGIAVASCFSVQDLSAVVCPMAEKEEVLESSSTSHPQSIESTPLLPQGVSAVALPDDHTIRTEPVPADQSKLKTTDASIDSLPQPIFNLDRSGEIFVRQEGLRASEEMLIRNDRKGQVDPAPISPEQQSSNLTLPVKTPPGALITDQGLTSVMEDVGAKIVFPAASVNVGIQSLERPSAGVQPLGMAQEQGTQPATLPGQSQPIPVIGDSGGGEQDPFGTDAQGAGDGAFFRSEGSGAPEPATRGNQPHFFNGQFTSAMQAQSSQQGEGSAVVTPAADRLKMAQAFLGEDHAATATSSSGKVQSVHVVLPAHDSGPLSVRISMTDQTVHAQFTTDRNDLGALLYTRQDQLQQNLAKSGLELGQFQVHIDQRGQQEALPDRQPRRNGEPSEHQPASQDRNQHAQDRERPNHRPPRALSLFA